MWWLLAALLVTAAVAIPLLIRARRRRAWRSELDGSCGEVDWFARTLIPQLQAAASTEQVAGGWVVAEPRVTAAEDGLTALEARGPDDDARGRARALRDAVRTAREDVTKRTMDQPSPELQEVAARLEDALVATQPPAL